MKKIHSYSEQSLNMQQYLYHPVVFILCLLGILLSACQGPIKHATVAQATVVANPIPELSKTTAHKTSQRQHSSPANQTPVNIWQRIRSELRLLGNYHPKVEHEIKRLQNNPDALNLLLSRSKPYIHYIVEQVEAKDLPGEIALLPAIESGFRPFAYSRLGAAGLWQFMPATGRMLGLQQNWWYDGRRDVIASTRAALEYLTMQNKRFDGDWLHALAAYNAGSGNVNRAIRNAEKNNQATDYWSLALPSETRNYIPRLLALAEIIYDPVYYGVSLPDIKNQPYFVSTENHQQIDLQIAAKLAKTPLRDFLHINPGFKHGVAHPEHARQLLVPIEHAVGFDYALARLPTHKRLRWHQHPIKRGESLGKIARKYRVPISAIRQANDLTGNRIHTGKKLLIPLSQTARTPTLTNVQKKVRYRVRPGDSLYGIARKFQVSIADLKRWNRVHKYIHTGQKLTVYLDQT